MAKACPFCDKANPTFIPMGMTSGYFRCDGCEAYGPNGTTRARALEKWNMRHGTTEDQLPLLREGASQASS